MLSELLALLGRAWSRLLIYPGGLSAFALVWLMLLVVRRHGVHPNTTGVQNLSGPLLRISAVVLPWLGLALLPLPFAAPLARPVDALLILTLLEWPVLLTIAAEARTDVAQLQRSAARRIAALLNGYPVLLLALLLLALDSGAFEVNALVRLPGDSADVLSTALHWFGAATLIVALVPVLGLGAFAATPPREPALLTGLRLRALGFVLLAALPWLQALTEQAWLLPLPPLLIGALLWACHTRPPANATRSLGRAYLTLAVLQLIALLSAASLVLQQRLV